MLVRLIIYNYRAAPYQSPGEGWPLFHWIARHKHLVWWKQAQHGEDLRLLARFFFRRGFIVEVGANNGIANSNSYLLERFGWNGILVEPDPRMVENCHRTRHFKVVQAAVVAPGQADHIKFYVCDKEPQFSSLGSDEWHNERVERQFGADSWTEIEVPALTLDSILTDQGATAPLDVVTVDVEGHEADVLQGFTISKWKPRIVIVERNHVDKNPYIVEYMAKNQYSYQLTTPIGSEKGNDWYVSPKEEATA